MGHSKISFSVTQQLEEPGIGGGLLPPLLQDVKRPVHMRLRWLNLIVLDLKIS
jgi:hypothetical protein